MSARLMSARDALRMCTSLRARAAHAHVPARPFCTVGPHTFDPRTGEILDADIEFGHKWIAFYAREYSRDASPQSSPTLGGAASAADGSGGHSSARTRLDERLERAQAEIDLLLGETKPTHAHGRPAAARPGPCGRAGHVHSAAELQLAAMAAGAGASAFSSESGGVDVPLAYLEQAIIETVAHEVGHTLGLRHNFRASTAYSLDTLTADPSRTSLTASVMDYTAASIPSNRSKQGAYYSTSIGAYDKWVIEYGYKVIEGEQPGVQGPELQAIAARGAREPTLAFSTDEDEPGTDGVQPLVNRWDLGSDPISFHEDRLALAQALLAESEERSVLEHESWTRQVAPVTSFLSIALHAGSYTAKYVGGFVFARTHKGDAGADGNPPPLPVTPVERAEQARAVRLAMQIVTQSFWLPAARAIARLPRRLPGGARCGPAIDEYCLGIGHAKIFEFQMKIRRLVLLALVQPQRLAGLQLQEWQESGSGGTPPLLPPPPPPEWNPAWLSRPAEINATSQLAEEGPSVSSLFNAIDMAISLPELSKLLEEAPAEAKIRYELQRVWIAALADFTTAGLAEPAAVATRLLVTMQGSTTALTGALGAPTSPGARQLAEHLATVAHLLNLWSRGISLPNST